MADYHLAKAQCWLDVSFHEYTRNDRSDFVQQALDQSLRLTALMQSNATPLPDAHAWLAGEPDISPGLDS